MNLSYNTNCTNCCPNVLKVTSISNTGGSYFLVVDPTNTINPENTCKYLVVVPCELLPTISTIDQVYLTINKVNYPLTDRVFGNNIFSDQIRFIPTQKNGKKIFRVVYGSQQPHFKIISHIIPQSNKVLN